jgi:hypothetical protein
MPHHLHDRRTTGAHRKTGAFTVLVMVVHVHIMIAKLRVPFVTMVTIVAMVAMMTMMTMMTMVPSLVELVVVLPGFAKMPSV